MNKHLNLKTRINPINLEYKTSGFLTGGDRPSCGYTRFIGKRVSKKSNKAQGIVEFALILPLLLFLIMGVIEFGRFLFVVSAVSSASREAARYGSATGEGSLSVTRYKDYAGIVDAARRVGSIAGIGNSQVTIKYDHGPGTSTFATCTSTACNPSIHLGDRIIVEINRSYETIVPLVKFPAVPIRSSTARTILTNVKIQ
ncbi:MAG TPA: TadE family protein [Anaerolineaceae bacterium]|nr:TadE family protein [Anaerolineaceae bacterium]